MSDINFYFFSKRRFQFSFFLDSPYFIHVKYRRNFSVFIFEACLILRNRSCFRMYYFAVFFLWSLCYRYFRRFLTKFRYLSSTRTFIVVNFFSILSNLRLLHSALPYCVQSLFTARFSVSVREKNVKLDLKFSFFIELSRVKRYWA